MDWECAFLYNLWNNITLLVQTGSPWKVCKEWLQFFVWTLRKSHSLTFYVLGSFYSITLPTWLGLWTPTPLVKKGTNLLTHRRLFFFCPHMRYIIAFFSPGNSCSVWEQKERKWQVHSQQVINYFLWFCLVSFFHSALCFTLSLSILFWAIHMPLPKLWYFNYLIWFLYRTPPYSVLTEGTS